MNVRKKPLKTTDDLKEETKYACSGCGTLVDVNSNFCRNCGEMFDGIEKTEDQIDRRNKTITIVCMVLAGLFWGISPTIIVHYSMTGDSSFLFWVMIFPGLIAGMVVWLVFRLFGGWPSANAMTVAGYAGLPIIGALIGWLVAKIIIGQLKTRDQALTNDRTKQRYRKITRICTIAGLLWGGLSIVVSFIAMHNNKLISFLFPVMIPSYVTWTLFAILSVDESLETIEMIIGSPIFGALIGWLAAKLIIGIYVSINAHRDNKTKQSAET